MKEIKAVVRPNRLAALREALHRIPGFPGMTVARVEGCTMLAGSEASKKLKDQLTDYLPKVRIEIVASDEMAGIIADRLVELGRSGPAGDGLVWVTEVERAVFVYKTGVGGEA